MSQLLFANKSSLLTSSVLASSVSSSSRLFSGRNCKSSKRLKGKFFSSSSSSSSLRKNLPSPLPPKSKAQSLSKPKISPAEAKRQYIEHQKRTGDFLKDPKASILRLQNEMNTTKQILNKEIEKPIWKRLVDRLRKKQHSLINLFVATLAYILAHRLHLKMKEITLLQHDVKKERNSNVQLRTILRFLHNPLLSENPSSSFEIEGKSTGSNSNEFIHDVILLASSEESDNNEDEDENKYESVSLFPSWLWPMRSMKDKQSECSSTTSGSSSARIIHNKEEPEQDMISIPKFVHALQFKLQEIVGDEGLNENEKKQKELERIWKEQHEQVSIASTNHNINNNKIEGLEKEQQQPKQVQENLNDTLTDIGQITTIQSLSQAPVDPQEQDESEVGSSVTSSTTSSSSRKARKRVFDM